jgi:hypothetical protein
VSVVPRFKTETEEKTEEKVSRHQQMELADDGDTVGVGHCSKVGGVTISPFPMFYSRVKNRCKVRTGILGQSTL